MSEERANGLDKFFKKLWKAAVLVTYPVWKPLQIVFGGVFKAFEGEEEILLLFAMMPIFFSVMFAPTFLFPEDTSMSECEERYGNSSFVPDTNCYNYTSLKMDTIDFMKDNGAATSDALQPYLGIETGYETTEFIEKMQKERILVQIGKTQGNDEVYYLNRGKFDVGKPNGLITDTEDVTVE